MTVSHFTLTSGSSLLSGLMNSFRLNYALETVKYCLTNRLEHLTLINDSPQLLSVKMNTCFQKVLGSIPALALYLWNVPQGYLKFRRYKNPFVNFRYDPPV